MSLCRYVVFHIWRDFDFDFPYASGWCLSARDFIELQISQSKSFGFLGTANSLDAFSAVIEISADLTGVFNALGKVYASSLQTCSRPFLQLTQLTLFVVQLSGAESLANIRDRQPCVTHSCACRANPRSIFSGSKARFMRSLNISSISRGSFV